MELINVTANTNMAYEEGKETVDVCIAFEQMKEEGMKQGIKQGIKQGMDILLEVIQKLRSGENVDSLIKIYGEDTVQKALSVE